MVSDVTSKLKSIIEDYNQTYELLLSWEKQNNQKKCTQMVDDLIARSSWKEVKPGLFVAEFKE